MWRWVGCLILAWMAAGDVMYAAPSARMAQNQVGEVTFEAEKVYADPFNDVTVDVIFRDPVGRERRVPAYWAGGKTWKVRYASAIAGLHRFRAESSSPDDRGLRLAGEVEVEAYRGENPVYRHGPLRVGEGKRYLEHLDGTPFLWLGDTWWMGLTKRLGWPEEFQRLAADRKAKGFNLIQIVAGLYPDMGAFDERGENEAGQPWEKGYARIRPEYFDSADRKIFYLVEQGFVPCIVGTWGYHLPWLGEEKMKKHLRYVYARWGALPMVWCVAGELNLPFYTSPEFHQPWEKQAAMWRPVIRYCREINCFERPITAHPSGPPPTSARGVLKEEGLIDFDMLQTPHGQMEALAPTVASVRYGQGLKPPMPVVNAEPSYEMLFDRTPAEVARLMFWASWMNGVKGYTYGANGIWQVNGRDKPYGKSPHGGDYGHIPWEEAMKLKGGDQVALGTRLLREYAWERMEPRPGWVSWAADKNEVALGDWIWFEEWAATNAPVGVRRFRRTFDIPDGAAVRSAILRVAADDRCSVRVNGQNVGSQETWRQIRAMEGVAAHVKPGPNVVTIEAENVKSDVIANPAGLLVGMVVTLSDGRRIEVKSDAIWKASRDGEHWADAKVVAKYGEGPWGRVDGASADSAMVPYAMGIERGDRIIYAPRGQAIVVGDVEKGVRYNGFYFDPVTGEKTAGPKYSPTDDQRWRVEPPAHGHDWVLVMEVAK